MSAAELLPRIPPFKDLTQDDIEHLARFVDQLHVKAQTVVVKAGETSLHMYGVIAGRLKVYTDTSDGVEVVLTLLGEGDIFGELGLIDGRPRSAHVEALDDSELVVITKQGLFEAIKRSPTVAWTMLERLANQLRERTDTIETLASKGASGRVADLLVRLARTHGRDYYTTASGPSAMPGALDAAVMIDIHLTQSEIAGFVGMSRERVNRTLSQLKAIGVLAQDAPRRRIVVADLPRLKQISETG